MSTLKRSIQPCGEWVWFLEDEFPEGLESAVQLGNDVVSILEKWKLLKLSAIEYPWLRLHRGAIGIYTKIAASLPMDRQEVISNIRATQPAGYPEAMINDLLFTGPGVWVDAGGKEREEPDLIQVTTTSGLAGVTLTLEVHHDIWSRYNFSGVLQEGVYSQNAPRLTSALREIDSTLPVSFENGEGTYFGYSYGFDVYVAGSGGDGEPYSAEDRL